MSSQYGEMLPIDLLLVYGVWWYGEYAITMLYQPLGVSA